MYGVLTRKQTQNSGLRLHFRFLVPGIRIPITIQPSPPVTRVSPPPVSVSNPAVMAEGAGAELVGRGAQPQRCQFKRLCFHRFSVTKRRQPVSLSDLIFRTTCHSIHRTEMTSLYYRGPRENWNRTIHLHRENQESASSRIPRLLLGQALVLQCAEDGVRNRLKLRSMTLVKSQENRLTSPAKSPSVTCLALHLQETLLRDDFCLSSNSPDHPVLLTRHEKWEKSVKLTANQKTCIVPCSLNFKILTQ